jgi:hypothetical protein
MTPCSTACASSDSRTTDPLLLPFSSLRHLLAVHDFLPGAARDEEADDLDLAASAAAPGASEVVSSCSRPCLLYASLPCFLLPSTSLLLALLPSTSSLPLDLPARR